MALWYAYGKYETGEAKPASAFTKGDILMLTSASSLSMLPQVGQTTGDLVGIAQSDSADSVANKVVYTKITPDTVFWSNCTPGSTFTAGAKVNFNFGALTKGWGANSSSGTIMAVCERGVADIEGQSVESRILVRFGTNASVGTLVHG